jgi:transglutaminase-like putative cysteine protease
MKAQLFEVSHTTRYGYRSDVTVAHHLLHLTPRALPRQVRLAHELRITPTPAATSRHVDYFANDVTFVTLEGAHRTLEVTAFSRVAVGPAFIPDPAETPPWDRVRGWCRTDRSAPFLEAVEFSYASPLLPLEPRFADYARESFVAGRPILEAALDLTARIHRDFRFDATATTVATPLVQVLEERRGVCQDFAHLQIACFRGLGLPARYVSGYLETVPPPGQARLTGADASHAWVAFFCPGIGWIDVDPTNNLLPSLQHITLGWGRDYSDVAPIHGVLVGGDDHALTVAVDVLPQGATEIEPANRPEP